MFRTAGSLALLVVFSLPPAALPQEKPGDALPLAVAEGAVEKVDKDSLTFQPRGPGGRFEKAVTLRIAGTTRITLLAAQQRDKKAVLSQREVEAKDLKPGQAIAVIYTTPGGKEGPVLLSAVVQPPPAK